MIPHVMSNENIVLVIALLQRVMTNDFEDLGICIMHVCRTLYEHWLLFG